MPDSRRAEARTPSGEADRNSLSETLLDEGLARYFEGRYEDAIHLWTRVLFLDRSHARARAYIDRARSMLAERQRRSDEMLETSRDLLDQGHTDAARHLLSEAIAATGDDDRASALRLRLDQLERASVMPASVPSRATSVDPIGGWTWHRWRWTSMGALVALALVIAALTVPVARNQIGLGSPDAVIATSAATLPVLSSADVALVRARNLYNGGRLAEALQALDRVSPESAVRAEADVLRVNIQRLLLASGQEPSRALQSQRGSVRR
jgi:tetratricopeptide (TPR) repeat protein